VERKEAIIELVQTEINYLNDLQILKEVRRIVDINIVFMMLICQPKLTIDVAPCFVLQATRSLVGILHNNGLRHSALF
jgi:hypothetical protein